MNISLTWEFLVAQKLVPRNVHLLLLLHIYWAVPVSLKICYIQVIIEEKALKFTSSASCTLY